VRASLGQMAKKSFWNAHDHLGGCILLNFLWSLFCLPWLALAVLLVTAGWTQVTLGHGILGLMVSVAGVQQLMLCPASAALWTVTGRWAHRQDAAARNFFPALRKFFVRSLILWLCFLVAALVLSLNIFFYNHLLRETPLIGAFLVSLMGWAHLFLGLMQIYVLPLLVQEDTTVRGTLRRSARLVLGHPWYTLILGFVLSLVWLIGLISIAGLLFICVGLVGVIANTGLREIMRSTRSKREAVTPKTWAEVRKAERDTEEETRGWRDLWRPWGS